MVEHNPVTYLEDEQMSLDEKLKKHDLFCLQVPPLGDTLTSGITCSESVTVDGTSCLTTNGPALESAFSIELCSRLGIALK